MNFSELHLTYGRYVDGDRKVYMGDSTFTKRTIFSGWNTLEYAYTDRCISQLVKSLGKMIKNIINVIWILPILQQEEHWSYLWMINPMRSRELFKKTNHLSNKTDKENSMKFNNTIV